MAKRPIYPKDISRKYRELPDHHSSRTTDEKLHAADALEQYWSEDQSFSAIEDRDDVHVESTTISRAYLDFFGPEDEDLTFRELGEKYAEDENEDDWSEALNDYLRARKHDRLDEFKRARESIQRQQESEDVPTPLNARELEIASDYYQRGVQDTLDELGVNQDDLDNRQRKELVED